MVYAVIMIGLVSASQLESRRNVLPEVKHMSFD